MASGRGGGYILSKRPPLSPDKSQTTTGGFKQRRTEGLSPEGANIITGVQRDVGPMEVRHQTLHVVFRTLSLWCHKRRLWCHKRR